ncbi:unnamed protein product, partial [Ectocarpus sp. 4 AP-2014]
CVIYIYVLCSVKVSCCVAHIQEWLHHVISADTSPHLPPFTMYSIFGVRMLMYTTLLTFVALIASSVRSLSDAHARGGAAGFKYRYAGKPDYPPLSHIGVTAVVSICFHAAPRYCADAYRLCNDAEEGHVVRTVPCH